MKGNQPDTKEARQADGNIRATITINGQTYLRLLKQAEQEGQSLSQVIAATIEQQLSNDLPINPGSKRLTISLPKRTHAALLKRKNKEQKSLSGLVSCLLNSANDLPPPTGA